MKCLKCADTGMDANGNPCSCRVGTSDAELPVILDIPEQYQSVYFDMSFLPKKMHASYGYALQKIISEIKTSYVLSKNLLICAPPNSGKTVFAYTIYRIIYQAGLPTSQLYDLNEIRKLMNDIYSKQEDVYNTFLNVKIAIVKIPLDLPMRFAETIATILDLRLRHSGKTIFLYDGSKEDLLAQDKYDRLSYMIGDGSYHTMECYSYSKQIEELVEAQK